MGGEVPVFSTGTSPQISRRQKNPSARKNELSSSRKSLEAIGPTFHPAPGAKKFSTPNKTHLERAATS
jgi:hypothetical protein